MEKINVVLVVMKRESLESVVNQLNLAKINLIRIVFDKNAKEKTFKVGDEEIQLRSLNNTIPLTRAWKECIWLISGHMNDVKEIGRMKIFLMSHGIPEKNIVNFNVASQLSKTWLGNLRHVEEEGADFFATGNEYMQVGLNMKYIPCVQEDKDKIRGGACLADSYQDLRQSYLIAKHVFEHVEPGTIKFVLIGLAPYSFRYNCARDFSNRTKNFQYLFALNLEEKTTHDTLLKDLLNDEVKANFMATTSEEADLNFDAIKEEFYREFSMKAVADLTMDTKFLTSEVIEKNIEILKAYIRLCLNNGAKPVGVVFPFAPSIRKMYNKEILTSFREAIHQLEENYDFMCIDWFDHFAYDCFCDMTHLNLRGSLLMNSVISMKLNSRNLIPAKSFCDRWLP